MAARAIATYVYCIVAARTRPSLARMPSGPPGTGPVRLVEIKPARYLVVSDAPLDRFGEGPLARRLAKLDWVSRAAFAHEAVVERFIGCEALLPMKLFTIFTSDERAVQKVLADWRRIKPLLRHLASHVEWGVRLIGDPKGPPAPDVKRASTGRAYLAAKRSQRDDVIARRRHARESAGDLFDALAATTRDARRRPLAAPVEGGRLLLDAAFLVATSRSARFRANVARHARALTRHGCEVQVTGPWPPYSFIEDAG